MNNDDIIHYVDISNELHNLNKLEIYKTLISKSFHEFRNILSIIIGYSDIIKTKTTLSEIENECNVISDSALKLKIILDNLQFLKTDIEIYNVNVGKLLLKIISLLKLICRNLNITCYFNITNETTYINVSFLERIILNILLNAIYAISINGGCIHVEYINYDDHFEIYIHDTGIGISNVNLDNIFNLFFTTHEDTSAGIGLPIVVNLIKQLNGSFYVNNEDWTTFTIHIPK